MQTGRLQNDRPEYLHFCPLCDGSQLAETARALPDSLTVENPRFVCREVAIELVWVLERAYGFSRDRIPTTLEELVATESLVVEEADDVARTAFRYRTAGAGFSDLMVLAAAERSGAYPLVTFDRKAARLEGVSLL